MSAEQLILRLLSACFHNGRLAPRRENPDDPSKSVKGDLPEQKPHGRLAWSIHFDNGLYLDVSVMPRKS